MQADEYGTHAIFCRNMAEEAGSDEMKARWLHLAESWYIMVTDSPRLATLAAMVEYISVRSRNSR